MAGNVKEWVWNDTGSGKRYLLGGAWNEPDYQFLYSDSRDRPSIARRSTASMHDRRRAAGAPGAR